jgi:hypothetical protein
VTTTVEPHIDDECLVVEFGEQTAVELGEPPRLHVRDVQVSDPAIGAFVDERPVCVHPLAIAGELFTGEWTYPQCPDRTVRAADAELDLLLGLVDQQRGRRTEPVHRDPIDRHHHVARLHIEARPGQR